MAAQRDGLAGEDRAHFARALAHIDAMPRIARVAEYLLVLFEPMIDLVTIEGDQILDPRGLKRWIGVAPGRVFAAPLADRERPVRRLACVGGMAAMGARFEDICAHVPGRKVIDRQLLGPRDHNGAQGIDNGLSAHDRANTLGARLEAEISRARWPNRRHATTYLPSGSPPGFDSQTHAFFSAS